MENIGISLGSILAAAFIFYFVIKYAVKSAIIETKVHEKELIARELNKGEIDKLTLILYGEHGLGTEIFNNLTKEQKAELKPEFKEITQRYNKLIFEYNDNKANAEVVAITEMVDKLMIKIKNYEKINQKSDG